MGSYGRKGLPQKASKLPISGEAAESGVGGGDGEGHDGIQLECQRRAAPILLGGSSPTPSTVTRFSLIQ